MLAKDVMTRDVITIPPEMPVVDIADLLLSRKVGAVAVVDGEGRLLGIVSEADLMHRSEIGTKRQHSWWQHVFAGHEQQAADFMKEHGVQASHVMTRDPPSAREETSLAEVVALFDRFRVERVPIVHDHRVIGMVTRSDVLRPLAALKQRPAMAPDASDAGIRAQLEKIMDEAEWATVTPVSSSITFDVKEGSVHLMGVVDSEADREALCIAAAAIPGVRSLQADIALAPHGITAI